MARELNGESESELEEGDEPDTGMIRAMLSFVPVQLIKCRFIKHTCVIGNNRAFQVCPIPRQYNC